MIKIVCTGPESTGKTTLSQQLANHYECSWVAEYARGYLEGLGSPYQETDLDIIAEGQIELENMMAGLGGDLVVCDTDLLTIKIWSQVKYGRCSDWLLEKYALRANDLYLLCGIDIPWEADPQRENPDDREKIYELYKNELVITRRPFIELSGDQVIRFRDAMAEIDNRLNKIKYGEKKGGAPLDF